MLRQWEKILIVCLCRSSVKLFPSLFLTKTSLIVFGYYLLRPPMWICKRMTQIRRYSDREIVEGQGRVKVEVRVIHFHIHLRGTIALTAFSQFWYSTAHTSAARYIHSPEKSMWQSAITANTQQRHRLIEGSKVYFPWTLDTLLVCFLLEPF